MANGQFAVADVVGRFRQGQQFAQQQLAQEQQFAQREAQAQQRQQQFSQQQTQFEQQQQLAPLQLQSAQLGVQQQQQKLSASEREEALGRTIDTVLEIRNIPDNQKAAFLTSKIQQGELANRDMAETKKALEMVNAGRFAELAEGGELVIKNAIQTGRLKAPATKKLSSLQQKVEAEGLDPFTPEGQARAREITQGSRTDPSLKPSDQALLNKANEGQLASSVFANRVGAANDVLAELEAIPDFDPTSLQTAFFEAIPGGNLALSDNEQRFAQAKRDFITAVLRKESGAAIGKDEFINEDKKFFPQVGDKPAVLKQKAIGRKRAFDNLKAQSKGVFDVQFGNKSGALSKAEQAELQQLRAEFGGQ